MSNRHPLLKRGAIAAIAFALSNTLTAASAGATTEGRVKAAYLFKLASFVKWPSDAFGGAGDPLRICVAGRDDVAIVVEALVRGQRAGGRSLLAERIDAQSPEKALRCQILFVGRAEPAARDLLELVDERPILTVTDQSAGSRGGIIEFVSVNGSVRFAIHRDAAEARRLILSSKLLSVAESLEP